MEQVILWLTIFTASWAAEVVADIWKLWRSNVRLNKILGSSAESSSTDDGNQLCCCGELAARGSSFIVPDL